MEYSRQNLTGASKCYLKNISKILSILLSVLKALKKGVEKFLMDIYAYSQMHESER